MMRLLLPNPDTPRSYAHSPIEQRLNLHTMAADEYCSLDERKPTLITIPPEIRQIIYRYTYSGNTNIDLECESCDSIRCKSGNSSAILRVCKLFYTEAKSIFSGQCSYHVRYDERYATATDHGCLDLRERTFALGLSKISSITIDVYSLGSTTHRPGPPNPTPPFSSDLYMSHSRLVDIPLTPSIFPVLAEVILHCQHLYKIGESHDAQFAAPKEDVAIIVKPRYVNNIPILSFSGDQSARFAFNRRNRIVNFIQVSASNSKMLRDSSTDGNKSDTSDLSPFSACGETYARSEGFIAFDD